MCRGTEPLGMALKEANTECGSPSSSGRQAVVVAGKTTINAQLAGNAMIDFVNCDVCKEAKAVLFCPRDRQVFCRHCDVASHAGADYTASHERFSLTETRVSNLYSAEAGLRFVGGPFDVRKEAGSAGDGDGNWADAFFDFTSGPAGFGDEGLMSKCEKISDAGSPCLPSISGGTSADTASCEDLCSFQGYDDMEELNWLSAFVEDSYAGDDSLLLRATVSGDSLCASPSASLTPSDGEGSGNIEGGTGARSKRSRSELLGAFGDASLEEKPRKVARKAKVRRGRPDALAECLSSSDLITFDQELLKISAPKPSAPKPQRTNTPERTCLHCSTTKTPQWRTGPMGPKTLCNACGVRYKSGRLVPEYRPAGSPGYVGNRYTNRAPKLSKLSKAKLKKQKAKLQEAAAEMAARIEVELH